MIRFYLLFACLLWTMATLLTAQNIEQNTAILSGTITDQKGKALPEVNVAVINSAKNIGTSSDLEGNYTLQVPANQPLRIGFSFIGYKAIDTLLYFETNQRKQFDVALESISEKLPDIIISEKEQFNSSNITYIDAKLIENIPSTSGGIESIIQTLPGVVSNNELSSQYSVRGGNFDENLVYVNDFEIFRPFLIRSGQQEGLSFINPDLVRSIAFSAGGFEAKYGDKMASVLDVAYKKPKKFGASISLSLLGVNTHLEGSAGKDNRFTYLLGIRQRSNKYLFNALPNKGEYSPSFTDIQSFLTYRLSRNWELQLISNYARNSFRYIPVEQETSFGTFNQALKLEVFFEGNENDSYQTAMGGLGAVYTSDNNRLTMKLLSSAYRSKEVEAFSILGAYRIGEVENNLGEENLGELTNILGVGVYHDWARNTLFTTVANVSHRGAYDFGQNYLSWGIKYQHEVIEDQLNEWYKTDSAQYNIPYNGNEVILPSVLKTELGLSSNRYMAFVQNDWSLDTDDRLKISGGMRVHYWDVNKEWLFSPRLQIAYNPKFNFKLDSLAEKQGAVERDLFFRLAIGAYYQPPFYREMRNYEGELNTDLKAQKSIHAVFGLDYTFNMWNRPFKFTTELYYKRMWDLVPYDYDNLLIRYFGENRATGLAMGADFRLNGEFLPGTESWISVSVMRAQEDLDGDSYLFFSDSLGNIAFTPETITDTTLVEVGSLPRPTDQRVTFAMLFQDYLPNNKNFKMHLKLIVGTGLPYGPANASPQLRNVFRIPPYRRVDIGFSALLFDREKAELPSRSFLRHFRNVWASVEIFNLLGVGNTVSYTWIKALSSARNQEILYPVPNKLTSRRLNVRLVAKF